MSTPEQELMAAVGALPEEIAVPMFVALERGELRIGACSYETELAVCPVAAAAMTAGVWHEGWPRVGGSEWGTEEAPSSEVEEFAACFDLCAEERGLEQAIVIVIVTLSDLAATARA